MKPEGIKMTGNVKVELIRDGKVVYTHEDHNAITTTGKNDLATLLSSASAGTSWATHMAFGASSTAVSGSETALVSELTGYTRPTVTRSVASNKITYQGTLSGLTGVTINEAGLVNAATGGALHARYLTGAVTLSSSSDQLQVTWDITFS